MWDNFLTLLADVVQRRGNRWKTVSEMLPLIILGILYALGQLAKAKKQKKNQPPTPRPMQERKPLQPTTTQSKRLPSYARGRTTSPQPPQRPQQATPQTPAPRPIIPSSPAPQRVPRVAQPAATPPPRPAKPAAPKPSHRRVAERKAAAPARPEPQRRTSRPAAPARQTAQKTSEPPTRSDASTGKKLQITLDRSSDLARAFIYAEVLGKPMALRPAGSFDLGV